MRLDPMRQFVRDLKHWGSYRGLALRRLFCGRRYVLTIDVLTLDVLALAGALLFCSPAYADKRLALVMGNDRYINLPATSQLKKAVNDAEAVGDTFARLGFNVIRGRNLSRQGMIDKLVELTERFEPGG